MDDRVSARCARAEAVFVSSLAAGEVTIVDLPAGDWRRCAELIERYRDLGPGLVDASVAAVAERLGLRVIARRTDATSLPWISAHDGIRNCSRSPSGTARGVLTSRSPCCGRCDCCHGGGAGRVVWWRSVSLGVAGCFGGGVG